MPKNGERLSILGFGCMRLPMRNGETDEIRAIGQIHSAVDQGVNYVDTAWPYHAGESELLVGRALRNGYRDRVKLATKLPSSRWGILIVTLPAERGTGGWPDRLEWR